MTIEPDSLEEFLEQFDRAAPQIRSFSGCRHLELWQDAHFPNICTTYSHWESQDALTAYRGSSLFQSTWSTVKPLFAARPRAYSYTIAREAPAIEKEAHPSSNSSDSGEA